MTDETPEGVAFGSLGAPNRATAETIWNSTPNPSTRKVAEKMQNLGWQISAKTVARWHNAGWKEPEGRKPKEADLVKRLSRKVRATAEKLEGIAELKGDPQIEDAKQNIPPAAEFEGAKFEELMKLSKEELKEKFDKTTMAAGVLLAEAVIRHRDALAAMPKDLGNFINDLSESTSLLRITNDDIPDFANGGTPGDGAKVINGAVIPAPAVNPVSSAIAQFRQKNGVAA